MSHPRPCRPRTPRVIHRLLVDACDKCGRVLAQVDGCTTTPHPTVPPWGYENWWADEPESEPLDRCLDCAARIGHHHHWDCLRAWCDTCREPLYRCAHVDEVTL